ncbi:hypothetical protein UlMin_019644 [Ulmus minor]
MANEREKEKISVKSSWNYPYELKLLLIVMLTLFSFATLFQFLPSRFTISTSDLRFCNTSSSPLSPSPPSLNQDQLLPDGVLKRAFNSYGSSAYSFISMSAYRGGLNTFAIIGLASKPLQVFGYPTYECRWVPQLNSSEYISTVAYRMLPDKGHGHVYSVVVLNCTFSQPINPNNSGGKLNLYANNTGGGDWSSNRIEIIEVLSESPGSLNFSLFTSPPKYDHFYCGSPLFGNLSPQRIREWLAYHVWLFGPKSHFVMYNSGGIHEEVMEVVKPWMELGYVSLHDIRDQERFFGFYHNQFMILNDCLHRYKFMGEWMFFFDVDEFVYTAPNNTIKSVLNSLSEYTQYAFPQKRMSFNLCLSLSDDAEQTYREWGFEKLVYRDMRRLKWPQKYVVQPRNVYSAGVHISQNLIGKTFKWTDSPIMYFHYHRTIANRPEPCKMLINSTEINFDNHSFVLDTSMRDLASFVKKFELKMIGSTLQNTPQ